MIPGLNSVTPVTTFLPIELHKLGFAGFVDTTFNLIKTYIEQLPKGEKTAARDLYVKCERMVDDRYNEVAREALKAEENSFFKKYAQLKVQDSRRYHTLLHRTLHVKEKELLSGELKERFGSLPSSSLQLKSDPDTFTKDRWLHALFALKNMDVSVKEEDFCHTSAESELYAKVSRNVITLGSDLLYRQYMPGLFESHDEEVSYQKLCERKETVQKQLEAKEAWRILHEESDFPLIHANTGANGSGGGRSPYSEFTERVVTHVTTLARDILQRAEVVTVASKKDRKKLEKLNATDRSILLANVLVDTYSGLQFLRSSTFDKIRFNFIEKNIRIEIPNPKTIALDDGLRLSFEKMKEEIAKVKLKAMSDKSWDMDLLKALADGFKLEVERARKPLKRMILLLEIHLDKDFTKEIKVPAAKLQRTESSKFSTSPKGSMVTPRGELDGFRPRIGSVMLAASPREAFIDEKIEHRVRIQKCVDLFKLVYSVLKEVTKKGKK